jgi:hypothetical protein
VIKYFTAIQINPPSILFLRYWSEKLILNYVDHIFLYRSGEKSTLPATGKEKDKDTDSIGSASDLKHEEDTTDDERHVEGLVGVVVPIQVDQEKIEDEDDGAYESVQYGTLEETASAIQSLVSHKSILQETSSKPLLDNGFDKSDDDDMEQVKPPAVTAVPQRRLTFESMGLLSVFDQIPFRQPKKSKTFASLKTSDQASLRLTDGKLHNFSSVAVSFFIS